MLFFKLPLKGLLPDQIYNPLKDNLCELARYAEAKIGQSFDFRVRASLFLADLSTLGKYSLAITVASLPNAAAALTSYFQVEATHYSLFLDTAALPALSNALEQVKAGTCGEAVAATNGITGYQSIQTWNYPAKVVASLARGQNETCRPFFEDCAGNLVSSVIDLHKANIAKDDKNLMIIAVSVTAVSLCACAVGFFKYRHLKAQRQAPAIRMKDFVEGGEALPLLRS